MNKPEIAIIIPCYNCSETLEEAVESCYVQGLENFEIVMVDDGSTDDTKAVMTELASKHPEIKLFYHDKNRGGGATRNTAVEKSKAEIIFCLDSDDILPENTLSNMITFMKKKKCDGVGIHHSIKFIGNNIQNISHINTFGYLGQIIPLESLMEKQEGPFCPLYSTFMITRRAFDAIGGYPEYHGFDTQSLAWRFLAGGFTAYTCPEATYLHRIQFKKSYYLREAEAGKANYNWQDIFKEFIFLFTEETQKFILDFDCKDFSKSLFEELKKRDNIFKKNYVELIGTPRVKENISTQDRVLIKRNSVQGFIIRAKAKISSKLYVAFVKLKVLLKKFPILRQVTINCYVVVKNINDALSEQVSKKEYYSSIKKIKKNKKIILDIHFGGLGDWLVFTTLPRLLKETYGIDFYLSRRSLSTLRNPDTYKILFEVNPYFKGISDDAEVFTLQFFASEKSLWNFFTDRNGENIIEKLERQFGCKGKGVPEIYYKPKLLKQYGNVVLVDKNYISGLKLGWHYDEKSFEREIQKELAKDPNSSSVEHVEVTKQDLFTYVDMIYSCKHFITVLSGGAALAACFKKPFTSLLPYDVFGGSVDQFVFKKGAGVYVK